MNEAPERIWAEDISKAWLDDSGVWGVAREDHDVEYIRVDIHDARIKELEAQVTWQPIETAPKDGTVIFVWYEPAIKHYSAFRNEIKKARWLDDLEEWSVEGVGGNVAPTVTHWMRLPETPKEDET
jgi:hypothetical protein